MILYYSPLIWVCLIILFFKINFLFHQMIIKINIHLKTIEYHLRKKNAFKGYTIKYYYYWKNVIILFENRAKNQIIFN
jgi:hypothetical protein